MIKFIDRPLPKKCRGGLLNPQGIVYHFISAINAQELGLSNADPYSVEVCAKMLEKMGYSYHVMIDRDGNAHQLVPFDCKAWHAGVSMLNGRIDCNDWALGIVFLSTGKNSKALGPAYTEAQIRTGLELQDQLRKKYLITLAAIGGHDEVRNNALAADLRKKDGTVPDRKPDPGALFPWGLFRPSKLHGYNAEQKAILEARRAAKQVA